MDCQKRKAPKDIAKYVATLTIVGIGRPALYLLVARLAWSPPFISGIWDGLEGV